MISLFGLDIQTYFLYLSLWTTFIVVLTYILARRENLNAGVALNTCAVILISGFIGARLMHIVFEHLDYYISYPKKVFYFWEGGFVFMGGMYAALFSVLIYYWWKKHSFTIWGDFFAPILALGYGGGRIACFLAGCCYGRVCLYPWKITGVDGVPRHPTQLYAFAFELTLAFGLFQLRKLKLKPGSVFALWLVGHGFGRLLLESFRDDFRGILIKGLTISTWFSFFTIIIGVIMLLSLQFKKTSANS